jgi:hypothetical protein
MHPNETLTVEGSPMGVLVFKAEGDGPHPGLVTCRSPIKGWKKIRSPSMSASSSPRRDTPA